MPLRVLINKNIGTYQLVSAGAPSGRMNLATTSTRPHPGEGVPCNGWAQFFVADFYCDHPCRARGVLPPPKIKTKRKLTQDFIHQRFSLAARFIKREIITPFRDFFIKQLEDDVIFADHGLDGVGERE